MQSPHKATQSAAAASMPAAAAAAAGGSTDGEGQVAGSCSLQGPGSAGGSASCDEEDRLTTQVVVSSLAGVLGWCLKRAWLAT